MSLLGFSCDAETCQTAFVFRVTMDVRDRMGHQVTKDKLDPKVGKDLKPN